MDDEMMLQELTEKLKLIENIYDYIRLVNPVENKILYYIKSSTDKIGEQDHDRACYSMWTKGIACYSDWNRSTVCENCISMRALDQKQAVFKIIYENAKVYFKSALPVELDGEWVVAELVKDITNDGVVMVEDQTILDIQNLITDKGSRIIKEALKRIYNEKHVNEKLPLDIHRSKEENRSLALFFLSLDNFKVINDLYGYQTGDYIISEFLKIVKVHCKSKCDWVSRHSGLKFILVKFDVDEKQAYRICKRIHDKVDKSQFCVKVPQEMILLSIGFHIIQGEHVSPDELIKTASKQIYTAWQAEKNTKLESVFEEFLDKFLLTEREKEVALLLLQGYSNNKIAETLFVGIPTVKKHVSNILYKTNFKSRAEFVTQMRY